MYRYRQFNPYYHGGGRSYAPRYPYYPGFTPIITYPIGYPRYPMLYPYRLPYRNRWW